jgi:predicted DNA-binding transcriptional regulator AlpA
MHTIDTPKTHRSKMRTPAAASYCGSTESTFNKLRLTGGGPIYITIGRTVVYDPDDLDAWLDSNRRKSTSVAA